MRCMPMQSSMLYFLLMVAGVVQQWRGPVGVLKPGGAFEPFGSELPLYVATKGMRQLAQHMADQVSVGSAQQVERDLENQGHSAFGCT